MKIVYDDSDSVKVRFFDLFTIILVPKKKDYDLFNDLLKNISSGKLSLSTVF